MARGFGLLEQTHVAQLVRDRDQHTEALNLIVERDLCGDDRLQKFVDGDHVACGCGTVVRDERVVHFERATLLGVTLLVDDELSGAVVVEHHMVHQDHPRHL